MKRIACGLLVALALVALPQTASAQLKIGGGGKLLFPTGDLNDQVTTGWGLAATGNFSILGLLSAVGEVSYNKFPAESGESAPGVPFEDLDVFGFTAGGRLNLALFFIGVDVGYFTDIDESAWLPNAGLKIAMFEIMARYKANDLNWFEVRGTLNF